MKGGSKLMMGRVVHHSKEQLGAAPPQDAYDQMLENIDKGRVAPSTVKEASKQLPKQQPAEQPGVLQRLRRWLPGGR